MMGTMGQCMVLALPCGMVRLLLRGEENCDLPGHLLNGLASHVDLPPAMLGAQPLGVAKLLPDILQ